MLAHVEAVPHDSVVAEVVERVDVRAGVGEHRHRVGRTGHPRIVSAPIPATSSTGPPAGVAVIQIANGGSPQPVHPGIPWK